MCGGPYQSARQGEAVRADVGGGRAGALGFRYCPNLEIPCCVISTVDRAETGWCSERSWAAGKTSTSNGGVLIKGLEVATSTRKVTATLGLADCANHHPRNSQQGTSILARDTKSDYGVRRSAYRA